MKKNKCRITDCGILAGMIAEACENERRRMAAEIHDVIKQDLAAISVLAGILEQKAGKDGLPGVLISATMIRDAARKGLESSVRLCADLLPADIEQDGLSAAIGKMLKAQCRPRGTSLVFKGSGPGEDPSPGTSLNVFRIAQESVRNALRHSGGSYVRVILENHGSSGRLIVRDNGCGMPVGGARRSGFGLAIMKYRAEASGLLLDIASERGKGTRVTCRWGK